MVIPPQTVAMIAKNLLPLIKGGGGGKGGSGQGSSLLGTATGLVQSIAGMVKKNKAKDMFPMDEDPEMRAYLNDIARKKRSFKTGSAFSESLKELKNEEALTNRGILSASGGSSGAAISGLGRTQKNTGDMFGKIAEAGMQEEFSLDQLYGNVLSNMSQKKLELSLLKYNQAMTEASDLAKHGKGNAMAGFNFLNGGGMKSPSTGTSVPTVANNFPGINKPGPVVGETGDTPMFDLSTLGIS